MTENMVHINDWHARDDDPSREQPSVHVRKYDDGTRAVRLDRVYPSGSEDEYEALCRMYALDPLHVAEPLRKLFNDAGEYEGFEMEYIDGTTLMDKYLAGTLTREDATQVEGIVARMQAAGLVHGDINAQNLIQDEDGVINVIDPIGALALTDKEQEALLAFDRQRLQSIRDMADRCDVAV